MFRQFHDLILRIVVDMVVIINLLPKPLLSATAKKIRDYI